MSNIKEQIKFESASVITHIIYRKLSPYDILEGPFSSACNSLLSLIKDVESLQIPIADFDKPLLFGPWKKEKKITLPRLLGNIVALKYLIDIAFISLYTIGYNLKNMSKKRVMIGIDPLSCIPLIFLKKIFGFTLIFYSVDFNEIRFKNKLLQFIYEKADEWSTKLSDQTWVVCESLKNYKKKRYNIDSFYIPNSSLFNGEFYKQSHRLRTGDKMAWTGSFLTDRQYNIFFDVLKYIQKTHPKINFYLVPTGEHERLENLIKKYNLKRAKVIRLFSREDWQKFAATCDIGIAIYDDQFGSTKFIEPLKIWDFMMCGLPFIISHEPSIATSIINSGVVYRLKPKNMIPKDGSLEKFISNVNIKKMQHSCLEIAKEYEFLKLMKINLNRLNQ